MRKKVTKAKKKGKSNWIAKYTKRIEGYEKDLLKRIVKNPQDLTLRNAKAYASEIKGLKNTIKELNLRLRNVEEVMAKFYDAFKD